MTNEEIDIQIGIIDAYYKTFLQLCCTVEISEEATAEVHGAYNGERWALIMKKSRHELEGDK